VHREIKEGGAAFDPGNAELRTDEADQLLPT